MSDTTRRDALARSIGVFMGDFNLDELRVVDAVVMRLRKGKDEHGDLDLSIDRDWDREEAEEHVDAMIYRACKLISTQDRERADVCAAAVREIDPLERMMRNPTPEPNTGTNKGFAHDWPGPDDLGGEG